MPQSAETVLDRYITLVDRAIHEPEALDELATVFAPDATVHLDHLPPVTGLDAIREFYQRFCGHVADAKHVWTTTVIDEKTLEAQFIAAQRSPDEELTARRGTERVTLDADGLITDLRAEAVPLT